MPEVNPAFKEQVFDVSQRQRKPGIHHHHKPDHLGREGRHRNGLSGLALLIAPGIGTRPRLLDPSDNAPPSSSVGRPVLVGGVTDRKDDPFWASPGAATRRRLHPSRHIEAIGIDVSQVIERIEFRSYCMAACVPDAILAINYDFHGVGPFRSCHSTSQTSGSESNPITWPPWSLGGFSGSSRNSGRRRSTSSYTIRISILAR